MSEKRKQMLELEEIARCIEHFLPRQLRTKDFVTDVWLKTRTKEISTYIREKKRWILIPMSDTQIHLTEELVYVLIYVLNDNWNGLKKMKPEVLSQELPQPQFLGSRLMSFIRILLIAVFPAIVFFIFELTPWHISGSVRDYVVIGLFIWGLVAIITSLDPNFNTKISAMKDITSIFPFRTDRKS
jgi:hypothetical protein